MKYVILNETYIRMYGFGRKRPRIQTRPMHRQRLIHNIPTKRMGRRHRIKRGSEIAFNIQPDSTLTLVPRKIMEKEGRENEAKPKEYYISIDPKENIQSTLRMIRALYAIGADIIRVHFKNTQDATKIQK